MSNVCDNMVCGEKLECFFVFFKKTGATSQLRGCYPFTTLDRIMFLYFYFYCCCGFFAARIFIIIFMFAMLFLLGFHICRVASQLLYLKQILCQQIKSI